MYEKMYEVRTDSWQWKTRKTVYKVVSRIMRNCDHHNCHAKQSEMEGPDL